MSARRCGCSPSPGPSPQKGEGLVDKDNSMGGAEKRKDHDTSWHDVPPALTLSLFISYATYEAPGLPKPSRPC